MKKFFIQFFVIISFIVLALSCTKELTDDIFDFEENFFSVQVGVNTNKVALEEEVIFTLDLEENDLPSVYTLSLSTNREGSFSTAQSQTIEAGEFDFVYLPVVEGIHRVNVTVTNANDVPLSFSENISIEVGDVSNLETGFKVEIMEDAEEVLVDENISITLHIIEEADVPENVNYTIDFQALPTGEFAFNGQNFIDKGQITTQENQLIFTFTPVELGVYDIKFTTVSSFDGSDFCESANFTAIGGVTDTIAPVITLGGDNPTILEVGDTFIETVTATDNIDGDITEDVVFTGTFMNTNTAGTFERIYNVSDEADNEALSMTRTITVGDAPDTIIPVITLEGDNPTILTVGDAFIETVTAMDNIDGDLTEDVVFTGTFMNTNTAGTFERIYNVSDASGNEAVSMTRTITVGDAPDTIIPVITLGGDNPTVLTVGDTFTETVTATDNIDGDLTEDVVFTGTFINTNTAGTFERIYNVSDEAGNDALSMTRSIEVEQPNNDPEALVVVTPSSLIGTTETLFTFDGSGSSDPDGDEISFSWSISLDDIFSTNAIATLTFDEPGEYEIILYLTDNNGGSDEKNIDIIVEEPEIPTIYDRTTGLLTAEPGAEVRVTLVLNENSSQEEASVYASSTSTGGVGSSLGRGRVFWDSEEDPSDPNFDLEDEFTFDMPSNGEVYLRGEIEGEFGNPGFVDVDVYIDGVREVQIFLDEESPIPEN